VGVGLVDRAIPILPIAPRLAGDREARVLGYHPVRRNTDDT